MLPIKSNAQSGRAFIVACSLLSIVSAHGAVIESFESGTLNGWGAATLNGTATTVNMDRATDGAFSAATSFTVPASFSGWTVNSIIEIDPRNIMDENTLTLSLDVYSDWANPNAWGVYGNTLRLILNNSNGWSTLDPTSGSLANGAFQTFTWDMSSVATAITDPGLGYSSLSIAWFVGTWAGGTDGLDNGTQTFAIDSIGVTSIPEPSSFLGFLAAATLLVRRRR